MFAIMPLLLAIALLVTGNGLVSTLVALSLEDRGANTMTTGLVMTTYFAGLALGCVWNGAQIRRVGHIRAFTAFAALIGATFLGFGLLTAVPAWALLRFVAGFSVAGLYMVIESWLNARATTANRGRVLGVYQAVVYLAFGLGQVLLSVPDPSGVHRFALAGLLVALGTLPVALTALPAPSMEAVRTVGLRHLWDKASLGLLAAGAGGLVTAALYGMGPVYGRGHGMDDGEVARFMILLLLGGLIFQWPLGRLSDVLDRRKVLGGAALLVGLASIGGLVAPALVDFGLVPFLLGAGAFTFYPMALAYAMDRMEPHELLPASAALLMAFGIGSVFGPVLAAAAMETLGGVGFLALVATLSVVILAYVAAIVRRYPPLPPEEKSRVVVVSATSPVALELDPRVDEAGWAGLHSDSAEAESGSV